MQRFFENTLESNFIKSILYNNPLPIYDVVEFKDYLFKGHCYIYETSVIKCTKSGILNNIFSNSLGQFLSDTSLSDDETAEYIEMQDYHLGDYYKNITNHFVSNTNYYDTETHERFGQYLRCISKIYGTNLMPLYNVFSYRSVHSLHIDAGNQLSDLNDNSCKVFIIPIKFNTTYTFAIDCYDVKMYPVLWNKTGVLKYNKTTLLQDFLDTENIFHCTTLAHPSYKFPTKIRIDTKNESLYQYQKYLYLLIQVPIKNESSLVMIEGDYYDSYDLLTKVDDEWQMDRNRTGRYSEFRVSADQENDGVPYIDVIDRKATSDLSLLQFNDGVIHPFAEKLIQYLTHNVITSREEIPNNIGNLQDIAVQIPFNGVMFEREDEVRDVWSNSFRAEMFMRYMASNSQNKFDINGFIDADIEKYLHNLAQKAGIE